MGPPNTAQPSNPFTYSQLSDSAMVPSWEHLTMGSMPDEIRKNAPKSKSGSSSPDNKRKRARSDFALSGDGKYEYTGRVVVAVSNTSDDAITVSQSGNFNQTAQDHILVYGTGSNECWVCGVHGFLQNAHVLPKMFAKPWCLDIFATDILGQNLIDFASVSSGANGMRLCAACHPAYDHIARPTLFIFPEDLVWFYNQEILDRARRREDMRENPGSSSMRWRITSAMYQKHQLDDKRIPEDGYPRYTRLTMGRQLNMPDPWFPYKPGPCLLGDGPVKPWGGSPMATLHKTFSGVGKMACSPPLPKHEKMMLPLLQDLYSQDIDLNDGREAYLKRVGDDVEDDGSPYDPGDYVEERKTRGKQPERPSRHHHAGAQGGAEGSSSNRASGACEAETLPPSPSATILSTLCVDTDLLKADVLAPPSPPSTVYATPKPSCPPSPIMAELSPGVKRKGESFLEENHLPATKIKSEHRVDNRSFDARQQNKWMLGPWSTAEDAVFFYQWAVGLGIKEKKPISKIDSFLY